MKQVCTDNVHGPAGPVGEPRIPRDVLAGVLQPVLVRQPAELPPRDGVEITAGAVVDPHRVGAVGGGVPRRRDNRVDDNIHGDQVHGALVVADDALDRAPAALHENAGDAAHVVHPAGVGLLPGGCN